MKKNKPKPISLFWIMLTIVAAIAIAGCGGSNNNSTGTSPGNLDGYFVNPTGNDTNPGTKDQPFRTIQAALDYAAQQAQPSTVYLAASIYTPSQTLQLRGGINLKGGYDPVTWERDISTKKSIIQGPQNMPVLNGYHQNSILVEGIVIVASDAVDSSQYPDNKSVVAVTLDSCFAITFAKDSVVTGDGLIGVDGNSPTYHSDGDNGASGQNGGVCPNSGGSGGFGYSYDYNNDGGDGANGGAAGGFSGSAGSGPDGGSGGSGGSLAGDGHRGTNGGPGVAGTNGNGGASFGMLDGTAYVVANGIAGSSGTPGSGGGGGGSGGGSIVGLCGGGGGGGGGGGYQGYVGGRGEGGGASIGFVIVNYSNVHIDSSYIVTGNGGDGGAGGTGAPGGAGGSGGSGGTSGFGTGAGGRGGDGGAGGRGGNGGGGGGGPVVGILEDANSQTTRSGNMFVMGNPGTGGISSSNAGADGEQTEYMKLTE